MSAAVVHPGGSVVATCSGQKQSPEFNDYGHGSFANTQQLKKMDSSLRIWQL